MDIFSDNCIHNRGYNNYKEKNLFLYKVSFTY